MYSTEVRASETTPPKKYSETTKKIVYGLAKVMGYYSEGSTAIKSSHELYNLCARQMELNKDFFVTCESCNLPDNFQTWFSVTQLHVWMLMVRLRAEGNGKLYTQELVNRFFDDAEDKIREYGISQQRVIKSYIKDLLAQFHGGVVAYDEGMCKDDPVLAAALWR
ncbi:ubiquinol-cytochrome C chaperone-domain-containing protein [Phycomyces blakesleeanus]